MNKVSNLFYCDTDLFAGKLPDNAKHLPTLDGDFPLYIKQDFLDSHQCDTMVQSLLDNNPDHRLRTVGPTEGDSARNTYYLPFDEAQRNVYEQAFNVAREEINRLFSLELIASEGAHGLGYPPGGKYDLHADNCSPVRDADGTLIRFEGADPLTRCISTLLFLSTGTEDGAGVNECLGGNLSFPYLRNDRGEPLIIEPLKGMFVAFPSNPYYSHQVHEVYAGYRISIVDWHQAHMGNT